MTWYCTKVGQEDRGACWEVAVKVWSDANPVHDNVKGIVISKGNDIDAVISERSAKLIDNETRKVSPLNSLQWNIAGFDERIAIKVFKGVVQYIRANPNCTLTQLQNAYVSAFPNAPWKEAILVAGLQRLISKRLGRTVTFVEFKQAVINNLCDLVD